MNAITKIIEYLKQFEEHNPESFYIVDSKFVGNIKQGILPEKKDVYILEGGALNESEKEDGTRSKFVILFIQNVEELAKEVHEYIPADK